MRMPDPHDKPTLTVPEAGAFFGLSPDRSYAAARSGDLPLIRIGQRMFVPTAALRELLGLGDCNADRI
jgi:hypothetical protein